MSDVTRLRMQLDNVIAHTSEVRVAFRLAERALLKAAAEHSEAKKTVDRLRVELRLAEKEMVRIGKEFEDAEHVVANGVDVPSSNGKGVLS